MLRYELLKCMDLYDELIKRVEGRIFINVTNGNFMIIIYGGYGIRYINESYLITKDTDIKQIANSIEYDYRNFIEKKYFK